jgi:SAM-dependent methyltransferase
MSAPPRIFDRQRLRLRRARSGALPSFLHMELAERLAERFGDVRRDWGSVLEIGARAGHLRAVLEEAGLAPRLHVELDLHPPAESGGTVLVADEEMLPFAPGTLDAVLSVSGLHLVNDLPGTLLQIRTALRPDGLLLAAMPGEGSLLELRWALTQAELEATGGAGPRVAPFVDVRDAGALLQRAGFAMPMVDLDRITVTYAEPAALLADLRAMGETGVLAFQRPLRRTVLLRALELYRDEFATADGRVPATFDILFLTGWRPAGGQPKPARRGSGQADLRAVLGGRRSGGDRD